MSKRWKPSVTVAAIIERRGSFLLVEEHTPEGLKLNNPSGHLDPGESLLQGVAREALEETGCGFAPRLGTAAQALVASTTARSAARPGRAASSTLMSAIPIRG